MLNSVSRNGNNPEYRGTIELGLNDGKIVVINELSLEQYLYAVVPSEMPSSYGIEALKVQAVCARSYAVSHMNNGALSAYGAQVNDSTDYQVYNVTPENENSISAVKATYGQVLMYNGEIANTYFLQPLVEVQQTLQYGEEVLFHISKVNYCVTMTITLIYLITIHLMNLSKQNMILMIKEVHGIDGILQ